MEEGNSSNQLSNPQEDEENLQNQSKSTTNLSFCRKEKRKLAKKLKRKQIRKQIALKSKQEEDEEEAKLNDDEEKIKLQLKEKEEQELLEIQRKEFEERERIWIEKAAKLAQQQQEEEERRKLLQEKDDNQDEEEDEDGDWEYVEEGPAEIIWKGNEIIVKKKKVKVPKRSSEKQVIEDVNRPTSNPLPPQSEVYASYRNTSVSDHQVFESVSQQNPNFGTEQDKAHCPFHIKTGACRFGVRCSRAHYYPDKSCTLLIKNMYNGPGLTVEQDEGLEFTDEEIDRGYEEFYEDVHTEFLKFGEIQNFKVCRNGSVHLRGNVYVHYKSLDSAILAYQSINGRFFAGKQITCEYVGVTRWRIAICGEYMKSRLKTCSRGTACNFIHCFRNPGGDYEWADWDNPPPKFWVRKMAALFGPSDEAVYGKYPEEERSGYRSRRSRSKEYASLSSSGDDRRDRNKKKHSSDSRKMKSIDESNLEDDHSLGEYSNVKDQYYSRSRRTHADRGSKGRDHSHREDDEHSRRREKSSRRGNASGRRETEWDEHYTKSEKYKLSDSSRDRRRKISRDSVPSDGEEMDVWSDERRNSKRREDNRNAKYDDDGREELDVDRKSERRENNRKEKYKDDGREELDVEKRNGCDSLKHRSSDGHSRKHRSSRYVEEDERKRSRKHSKRNDDKDVELESSSSKKRLRRSRSR